MNPHEIGITDFKRILLGEVPAEFYIEAIFRAAFVYLILIVSMRMMGKRMASQLSRNELAAMVSLAAAVGIPMMSPDRGVLPAVVVAIVIVTYQILISKRASHDEKFEQLTQDDLTILIKDGVLNLAEMKRTRVSRERLFGELRAFRQSHLGLVNRFYFEASGTFSIVESDEPVPGLSLLPEWDKEFFEKILVPTDQSVCHKCGNPGANTNDDGTCTKCGADHWVTAYVNR